MNLTDAAKPALDTILAAPAEGTVEFTLTGCRDGLLLASKATRPGKGDVVLEYHGTDRYTLCFGADIVTGVRHTLRRVLLTRLAYVAARIPANA